MHFKFTQCYWRSNESQLWFVFIPNFRIHIDFLAHSWKITVLFPYDRNEQFRVANCHMFFFRKLAMNLVVVHPKKHLGEINKNMVVKNSFFSSLLMRERYETVMILAVLHNSQPIFVQSQCVRVPDDDNQCFGSSKYDVQSLQCSKIKQINNLRFH